MTCRMVEWTCVLVGVHTDDMSYGRVDVCACRSSH